MPRQTLAEIHCALQPDEGVMTEIGTSGYKEREMGAPECPHTRQPKNAFEITGKGVQSVRQNFTISSPWNDLALLQRQFEKRALSGMGGQMD